MIDVLEDNGDRSRRSASSRGFISALNEDEQIDLVALMWLGRGDGTVDEWDELRGRAVEARGEYGNARAETARYLLGEPMLGDFLADGLDELGIDWTDERPLPIRPARASGARTTYPRLIRLARAVDDDGAELVALLDREMRLRGVRQRDIGRRCCADACPPPAIS